MSEVVLTLPDDLVEEASEMGLFSPALAASLFRAELRRRRANKFFEAADRLAALGGEPLSDEEISAEIAASRKKSSHK